MTIPTRCAGRDVLAQVVPHLCPRTVPNLLVYVCRQGHDGMIRACDPCAMVIVLGQDAKPSTTCPECPPGTEPAWLAIYCGMCRRGAHGDCRAVRGAGRALAGQSPLRAEDYCACSCDPTGDMVPGAGYAREHPEAVDA